MIPDQIRIVLAVLNFEESEQKLGLWQKKHPQQRLSAYVDFRKGDRGNCYFCGWDGEKPISIEKANPEETPPELLKFKQAEAAFYTTGKLPKEIEDVVQFRNDTERKQGQQLGSTPTQKPPAGAQQPAKDNGVWLTLNVDGDWRDFRFSEKEYNEARAEALGENLKALQACINIVNEEIKAGRLNGLMPAQAIEMLFGTMAQPAHYYFERKAKTAILDNEARSRNE